MNKPFLVGGIIFMFVLALYFATLHPFFPLGDSGEFIVVAKTFGVNHPPGFPLYSLFSYLFAGIPLATLTARLNLLSALFGASAITATFILLYRITRNYVAALAGALFLAFSHLFWFFSIITEAYSLSIFLIILLLLFFSEWLNDPKKLFFLNLTLFVGALSLMVQYVNIFPVALVAIFAIIVLKKQVLQLKFLASAGFWFMLGLTPLLVIPIAASHHNIINWDNAIDLPGFIRLITRSEYQVVGVGENLGISFTTIFSEQLPYYASILLKSFTPLGLVLAPLFILQKSRLLKLYLLSCFFLVGPILVSFINFSPNSPYPDVAINHKRLMEQVYVFSFPFIALFIGLGIDALYKWLLPVFEKSKLNKFVGLVLLVGVSIYSFSVNYPRVASARNSLFRDYGDNIMQTIEKPTILITGTEESNILYYLYAVEGKNKDNLRLITFSLLQTNWYVDQLKRRYPDVEFPFETIALGQKLDSFYEKNLQKFSIMFAPLDDHAVSSVSDRFVLVPYGLTTELLPAGKEPANREFQEKNRMLFDLLIGKEKLLNKKFLDLPTNELLMSYARGYTNVASRSRTYGDDKSALFWLERAISMQPDYYTAYWLAGSVYAKASEYDSAIRQYEEVLKRNPKHLDSLRSLAIVYANKKDGNSAIEYINKYINYSETLEQKLDGQRLLKEMLKI